MRRAFEILNHWLMRNFELRLEVPRDRRYRLAGSKKGLGVGRRVEFQCPEKISVGDHVSINSDCYLAGDGGLTIGDNVLIGPHCMIFTMNHRYKELAKPIRLQGVKMLPVHICDDVWIGAGSIILAGVTLGAGSIVGAGSVVTHNVDPLSIVAGSPAIPIGHRDE